MWIESKNKITVFEYIFFFFKENCCSLYTCKNPYILCIFLCSTLPLCSVSKGNVFSKSLSNTEGSFISFQAPAKVGVLLLNLS